MMGGLRLIIATGNRHKVEEIASILGGGFEVVGLDAFPGIIPDEETGETFEANAGIKAVSVSLRVGGLVLADDSGLEVDPLHGQPGVRSARFAGAGATDAMNRERLRRELERLQVSSGAPARFRCVLALARGGELMGTWSGAVEGEVIGSERGCGGFGYDAMFVPAGFARTFAELDPDTKNQLSHRARALAAIRPYLESLGIAKGGPG